MSMMCNNFENLWNIPFEPTFFTEVRYDVAMLSFCKNDLETLFSSTLPSSHTFLECVKKNHLNILLVMSLFMITSYFGIMQTVHYNAMFQRHLHSLASFVRD